MPDPEGDGTAEAPPPSDLELLLGLVETGEGPDLPEDDEGGG